MTYFYLRPASPGLMRITVAHILSRREHGDLISCCGSLLAPRSDCTVTLKPKFPVCGRCTLSARWTQV